MPPILTAGQNFVSYALSIGAIELVPEGRKLKSGRITPYFFNSARFKSGDSLWELASAYAQTMLNLDPDVLYGPPYKGTVLAPVVAAALWKKHTVKVGWATSRKEEKAHGEGGLWLGEAIMNKNVVIVDDVITDGATKVEALDLVRAAGGNVVGVVIAFDRMELAGESGLSATQIFHDQHNVPVYAVADLEDLIAVLEKDTDFPNNPPGMLEKIKAYQAEYGIA